jgi:hypothetical protein
MKPSFIAGTARGLFALSVQLLAIQTPAVGQDSLAAHGQRGERAHKTFFLWQNAQVTGGQLTLPFKVRKMQERRTFRLTTDVTLGGFVGYTRCISEEKKYFLTVPLTAGLAFINLSDNNTTFDRGEAVDQDLVPGISWSTGLIFQLDRYSFGLMLGKDYASNVGEQWEYHGKLWWSFGVGFAFLQD